MLRQASTKYQNVYSVIKNNIASNKWPVGKIIPSEHELVDYFRVSRITIRSALNMLENDGLVTRKRGKGTIVKNTTNNDNNCFQSLTQKILQNGDIPSSEILEFKKITNKDHTKYFSNDTTLYFIKRLRSVNEKPYLVSNAYVSYDLCFGLNENYFAEKGDNQSLIHVLTNNFKINFIENSQFVCAKELSNFDSKVLKKDPGTPCLSQDCLLFDHDNRLVLVDQNITFNTLSFNSKAIS